MTLRLRADLVALGTLPTASKVSESTEDAVPVEGSGRAASLTTSLLLLSGGLLRGSHGGNLGGLLGTLPLRDRSLLLQVALAADLLAQAIGHEAVRTQPVTRPGDL
eukprot:212273_1